MSVYYYLILNFINNISTKKIILDYKNKKEDYYVVYLIKKIIFKFKLTKIFIINLVSFYCTLETKANIKRVSKIYTKSI